MAPIHVFTVLCFIHTIVVAYHTCYDCARVPYPKDCDHVVKCTQDASCYVEEFISDSGLVLFNLGCRSKQRCSQTRKRQSATGDLIVCEECCQNDHCNSHGCNSQPLPPIGTTRGPVCYSCHQHAAEDSCDTLQVCDSTESCFLSPTHSSDGAPLFTSGCRLNNFCGNVALVGRRSNLLDKHCTGCCATDHCNRRCADVYSNSTQPATTELPTSPAPSTIAPSTTTHSSTTSYSSVTSTSSTLAKTTTSSVASTITTTILQPITTAEIFVDEKLCNLLGYEYMHIATIKKCYKLYTDVNRNWEQARDRCKQDGGDLVIFQSMDEKNFFIDQTKKSHPIDTLRFWVGATNLNQDSAPWRWLDGTPINASYFHTGEPNNQHGNEHCIALAQFEQTDKVIGLNDDVCSVATNSICEITTKELHSYSTPATPTHCRNHDYKYVESIGMCYKLYDHVVKNQVDARRTCQNERADLLILRNDAVEDYFLNLHFNVQDETQGRYWLGGKRIPGHYRNQFDDFQWYNGHVLSNDLKWFKDEPNNYQQAEDCLTFTYFTYAEPYHFALNDDRCEMSHYFICEEKCPDLSYLYFPNMDLCFKVYDELVTWSEARDRCRQDHADLLEPDTAKKLAFMEAFLNDTERGGPEEFWIGATDSNHDRTFEWMTSSKVVPADYWHLGEPSSTSAGEHCASLYLFSSDRRILMNDANCDTSRFRFICQDIW